MPDDAKLFDLNELDRLCRAAIGEANKIAADMYSVGQLRPKYGAFLAAANPEAVGRLIAAVRAAVNRLRRYEDECDVAREIGITPASVEGRP